MHTLLRASCVMIKPYILNTLAAYNFSALFVLLERVAFTGGVYWEGKVGGRCQSRAGWTRYGLCLL